MKKNVLAMILMFSVTAMGSENAAVTLPLPSAGNVTLPIAEYNKLLDLAKKPPKRPEAPPMAYTIQHAELKFRVGQESVLGTVQLDGEVFTKGETKVPLASGITVLDAHQQSKTLPLEQEGETSTAILPGPSEFSIMLDAGLQLDIEAGRASFKLPVPAAGSVRLSLVIPGDHSNVRINPGLITNHTSANGQTMIEAALAPGEPADISWTTREIAAPQAPRELRFLSDVKTLVSVNEADIRAAVLADVTVIQGEPSEFSVMIPAGYEVTGTSGSSVESSEVRDGVLSVKLADGAVRNHEFFISIEKPINTTKTDAPFVSFKDTQRETGEILVEGTGAMELTAKESGGLKRLDVKEVNANLRSLARFPLQAAFRYHRQPAETPGLALEWVRFPDSQVLAAVAERAIVTTLVTSEGRSLTEVKLVLRNQAQPFLKVDLPAGVNILSADVAGEKVKPVQGSDGSRVPLLRPGFRPTDVYFVSFVFMHSGAPFAKKGGSELELPKMDVPINLLQWEVFLPEQYKVKDFGGDAISTRLLPAAFRQVLEAAEAPSADELDAGVFLNRSVLNGPSVQAQSKSGTMGVAGKDFTQFAQLAPGVVNPALLPGQFGGIVVDPQGVVIPGAQVTVTQPDTGRKDTAVTNSNGEWVVSGLRSGKIKVTIEATGFNSAVRNVPYDANNPAKIGTPLAVGSTTETVEVSASPVNGRDLDRLQAFAKLQQPEPASSNVLNLQKRVAGVLPVRVDVPRAGSSYRFVRPLVLDEETHVSFSYKSR